jgi:hypothetical protein
MPPIGFPDDVLRRPLPTRCPKSRRIKKSAKKMKQAVPFFSADLLSLSTTQFTTNAPRLPRKKPRFAHPISQNPLQNTTSATQE